MTNISESELILPSLFVISRSGGAVSTTELIGKLRELLKPQGKDLEILLNRTDDKFSQKVRNLNSHKTLEDKGFANYEDKKFHITETGIAHLKKYEAPIQYLLNSFPSTDIAADLGAISKYSTDKPNEKIEQYEEDMSVFEGSLGTVSSIIYKRSKKLRDFAINKFEKNGLINCAACNFSFESFYGKELGQGFIEIHHVKPIFQYGKEDETKTINDALDNVVPLCSNCHRMVHRKKKNPLDIKELKAIVHSKRS